MDPTELAALQIRIGVGSVMLLFGLSQISSPGRWREYIPPVVRFIMPMQPETFMRIHALGNLGLGLILLLGLWLPVTVWLVLAWWLWVLPFAFYADISKGLRDVAIIMSLLALIVLIRL